MTDPLPGHYGEAPVDLGELLLPEWQEFMHYLYLPVCIPASDDPDSAFRAPEARLAQIAVPERLDFVRPALTAAVMDAHDTAEHLRDPYIYVTARRGFATPGNPLNRPGWHCDDFGGTDLNYIWSDRYPTRLLLNDGDLPLSTDDEVSMTDMRHLADIAEDIAAGNPYPDDECIQPRIVEAPVNRLLRLSPYVIHDTPIIPAPGGMRSFFKISVSSHRYNLLGNSHNYLLDYDWLMHDRQAIRNQPGGNGDYYEEPSNA